MASNVTSQEIFNAQNADEFLRCGFEVIVSNSKNNDTQNVTGIAINGDGDAEEAFAGGLYVQSEKTLNEGYTANGLHNLNTPYMQLAEGGAVEGKPGDHTGIYACNTYDVNKLSDGGLLIINFPGKTLGLITPAGERTDYTELIVGEQYKFGEVNFANADISGLADGDVLEIENGVFKKGSLDSVEAGYVYGKVHEFRAFTEGANLGTKGVIVKICRKVGGGSGSYTETTTFYSGNATAMASTGDSPEFQLEGVEGLDSSVKTITVVRSNATESNTYTLNYNELDAVWASEDALLQSGSEDYSLVFNDLTNADIGKVYNITISAEGIEPNFKAAVEEVANAVYETPADVENAIMSALPSLFAVAIQNGKSNTTVTLPTDAETSIQIKKIAEDVVSGKNVTVKISTGGYALKPIVGVANNNNFEYNLLFYYTYNTYVFRVTIGFSFDQVQAHMFAELMASP